MAFAGVGHMEPATAQRSARCCLGWSIARVAPSIIGVSMRIVPRGNVRLACRGSRQRGMPNECCRRMGPSPNTCARDGIGGLPPRAAKRGPTASRVKPQSWAQNGWPQRRVGGHRLRQAPAVVWCPYHPQPLDHASADAQGCVPAVPTLQCRIHRFGRRGRRDVPAHCNTRTEA